MPLVLFWTSCWFCTFLWQIFGTFHTQILTFEMILYFYITSHVLMLTGTILLFSGLLNMCHTVCTLITHIPNKLLLILCTTLLIFLQITFLGIILPNNRKFNSKYLIVQYIYPLWLSYYSEQTSYNRSKWNKTYTIFIIIWPTSNCLLTQDVIPFLKNIIFQYTNLLSFETDDHTIQTIPLIRGHCYSNLNYRQ